MLLGSCQLYVITVYGSALLLNVGLLAFYIFPWGGAGLNGYWTMFSAFVCECVFLFMLSPS